MFCLSILGCEIICIKAASFSSSNSEDECPKKRDLECQKVNLYCCVKLSIEGQCCTEKEYSKVSIKRTVPIKHTG